MNRLNKILARVNDKANRYRIVKEKIKHDELYDDIDLLITDSVLYDPNTLLDDDGLWYYVDNFSEQEYCLDLIKDNVFIETTNFNNINAKDLDNVKFLITYKNVTKNEGYIIFQKISSNKVLRNKKILMLNTNNVEIVTQNNNIIINNYPDAIYNISENRLYFKALLKIDSIFKGISELYREATNEEVEEFLDSDFVTTDEKFTADKIKTNNRKRIALILNELRKMTESDKKKIISYTKKYCPNLKYDNKQFIISSDKDLKSLLFGIQEKYFTTEITKQRKCANSTVDVE